MLVKQKPFQYVVLFDKDILRWVGSNEDQTLLRTEK